MSATSSPIVDGGLAAAISAVLIAVIQARGMKPGATTPTGKQQQSALRKALLGLADEADTLADELKDQAEAKKLRALARKARAQLVEE